MRGSARRVGRYELVRRVGRGGMGVVFLARDLEDGRQVALKEIAFGLADDPAATRRFTREATLIASLHHDNIVASHGLFWHDDAPFIVMEYVPCGSLRVHVGRLTNVQAAAVLHGVLAGLSHAHERGIVHRDLKPENLLFARDGTIKIADFGIAKALAETTGTLTATGGLLGSPTYLAPEQAAGGEVGPWTDLYSAGVIAYELFVGTPPFRAGAVPELLLRMINDPVPGPRELRPELPPRLERWLLCLLEKDSRRRPHDAATVAAELDAVMATWSGPTWRPAPPSGLDDPNAAPREHEALAATVATGPIRPARRAARLSWRLVPLAALVAAVAALPAVSGPIRRLELATVDTRFAVRGAHSAPSDIVIVAFDNRTIDELTGEGEAGWPQPRAVHARLIDALARGGAAVIAYPDAYAAMGPDPMHDDSIIQAIKRASDGGTEVVVGDEHWSDYSGEGLYFGDPVALLRNGAVAADSRSQPDADGVIRRIGSAATQDRTVIVEGKRIAVARDLESLAVAVAELPGGSPGAPFARSVGTRWIDFAGGVGTVPAVSASRVLKGRAAADAFRGKVVVVGETNPDERYRTPTSNAMPDVEIAANAIATARGGFPLRDVQRLLGVLLAVALALLPLVACRWRGRATAVAVSLGAAVVYAAIACIAFDRGAVLPIVYPLAALVLSTLAVLVLGPRPRRWHARGGSVGR